MKHAKKFLMYYFGSSSANMETYGMPYPLDIGENYGVVDIPIDVVAGLKDRLIPRSMVMKHYRMMKEAGVQVSYNEFEYAHLDFTFSHKEEILTYVMSRLQVGSSPTMKGFDSKSTKSRKSSYGSQKYQGSRDMRKSSKHSSRRSFGKQDNISTDDKLLEQPTSPISGRSSSEGSSTSANT